MMRALLIMAFAGTTLATTAGDAAAQWRYRNRGAWGVGVSPYGVGVYHGYYPYYGYYGESYSPYAYSYGSTPMYTESTPYTTTSGYTPQAGIVQAASNTTTDSQFKATLIVQLPSADAVVWLGNMQMTAEGKERRFESPVLEAGQNYSYTVKARWMADGKPVEQTRIVAVRAGQQSTVNFREQQMDKVPAPDRK